MTYPHTGTLLRTTESLGKYTYASNGTVNCFLQPLSNQEAIDYSIVFSKASACYMPIGTDIESGDRITVLSKTYGVKGIKKYQYGGLTHLKAILAEI